MFYGINDFGHAILIIDHKKISIYEGRMRLIEKI